MILMIDNYDSFTYNLVQYLSELGADVTVRRNDKITVDEAAAMCPERIVISPGPGTPDDAGISLALVKHFMAAATPENATPILGVCLGHQVLVQECGGKVAHANTIMHGKTSLIHHDGKGLYAGFPNPFRATRYHSLVAGKTDLPDCFDVTAWTLTRDEKNADNKIRDDRAPPPADADIGGGIAGIDEIMGVKHKTLPLVGVQFHPESILTDYGKELLEHFIKDEL